MIRSNEHGQTLIVIAIAMFALVAMILLILNGGTLLMQRGALDRAIRDAAIAGLRPYHAGHAEVNLSDIKKSVRHTLAVELNNVPRLQLPASQVADNAEINIYNPRNDTSCVSIGTDCVYGPVVEVIVRTVVCLPAWQCVTLTSEHKAALELVSLDMALPTPTPVPGFVYTITPPSTSTPSVRPSRTPAPALTIIGWPSPSPTSIISTRPRPTHTPKSTRPWPSRTPTPTPTPRPTRPRPTATPTPRPTRPRPTATPTPTRMVFVTEGPTRPPKSTRHAPSGYDQ